MAKIVKKAIRKVIIIVMPITYNNTAENLKWSYKSKGNNKKI